MKFKTLKNLSLQSVIVCALIYSPLSFSGDKSQNKYERHQKKVQNAVDPKPWFGNIPDRYNPYRNKRYRIGDPDVSFNKKSIHDPVYRDEILEWTSAGVRGGIPYLNKIITENVEHSLTLHDGATSDDINTAIQNAALIVENQIINGYGKQTNGKYWGVAILLRDGTYNIDKPIKMSSRVYLVGESRDGVKCKLSLSRGDGFYFGPGTSYSGIYRLTIEGSWGIPKQDWNGSEILVDEDRNFDFNKNVSDATSVAFVSRYDSDNDVISGQGSNNHFLDQVNIYNSANHPVRNNGDHITFRDIDIDGAHLKGGGAEGYFFLMNNHNLVTGSKITHLRHISIQGDNAKFNVLIDNDFRQEVSFHSKDDGDNLIEFNRIILPESVPSVSPNYFPIMGPWSFSSHNINLDSQNFIYRNYMRMDNHADGRNMPEFFRKRSANPNSTFGMKERAYQHPIIDNILNPSEPLVPVPNYPEGIIFSDNNVYKGPVIGVTRNDGHILNFPHFDAEGNNYPEPRGSTFYPVVLTGKKKR